MKLRTTDFKRFLKSDFTLASPLQVKDFEAMLLHWKALRVIEFSSHGDFDKFYFSFNSQKIVGKIKYARSTLARSYPSRKRNRQKFFKNSSGALLKKHDN